MNSDHGSRVSHGVTEGTEASRTVGNGFTPRSPRLLWWHVLLGVVAVTAVTLLFLHRPSGQFFFPRCTFYQHTGLLCPGCGGLRAAHEILHANLAAALRCNALLVLGPLVAAAWWFVRRSRGKDTEFPARIVWLIFAVVVGFVILRNLPGPTGRWLSP